MFPKPIVTQKPRKVKQSEAEIVMKKAALHNLGCKVNSYETEVFAELLAAEGYTIVPFTEKADLYIINTCSVTNIADRKSRQMLRRARSLNPDAKIVAMGCYVDTSPKDLIREGLCDEVIQNEKKDELLKRLSRPTDHTRAFVKVQDGCDQFCSYCIIPYARGRSRSREREEILSEIRGLSSHGCREVVLTGIHLSSYGKNTGDTLPDLVLEVSLISGVERIRLGSLEPRIITEELAEKLSKIPKLCPHFHLSMQSGCAETLRRMNRHYTPLEYREAVETLRRRFTHPAITTDVITGFPGETKEEFEETCRFLKDLSLYEIHVFPYSVRRGTRAEKMPMQIPEQVKKERAGVLLSLTKEQAKEFRRWYLGKEAEVLLEEEAENCGEKGYVGYTKEYVKLFSKNGSPNTIVRGVVGEDLVIADPG